MDKDQETTAKDHSNEIHKHSGAEVSLAEYSLPALGFQIDKNVSVIERHGAMLIFTPHANGLDGPTKRRNLAQPIMTRKVIRCIDHTDFAV